MKNLKNAKKVSNTNGLPFPKSFPKVPRKHPKNSTFGDFSRFWGHFWGKSGRFWEKEVQETRADELEYYDFFSEEIDWEAVMLNLTLSGIEEDLKAMNLVCVCNGEIAHEEQIVVVRSIKNVQDFLYGFSLQQCLQLPGNTLQQLGSEAAVHQGRVI